MYHILHFISVCRGKFEISSFTVKREDINKHKFEVEGRIQGLSEANSPHKKVSDRLAV